MEDLKRCCGLIDCVGGGSGENKLTDEDGGAIQVGGIDTGGGRAALTSLLVILAAAA